MLLTNADTSQRSPGLRQLTEAYARKEASVVAVHHVPHAWVSRYGIVEGNALEGGHVQVERLVEKPIQGETDSTMAIAGRYVLTPDVFDALDATEPGKNNEIQLTDALLALSKKRKMYAYEFEGTRFDAGDKFGYLQAIIAYALRHDELGEPFKAHLKDVAAAL